jgi:hypothetical protein
MSSLVALLLAACSGPFVRGVGSDVPADCPLAPVPALTGRGVWRCGLDEEFDGAALDRSVWTVEQTPVIGYARN